MPVYAQVKDTTLIKFPYTVGSLMEENPFTNYGSDPDLSIIFPQTNLAIENSYHLVEVQYSDVPQYDKSTQVCTQNELPTLVNNQWVLGYTVRPMTADEKNNYDNQLKSQNKLKAINLLQETDWVELKSVSDPAIKPHLENYGDFMQYRTQLRSIAVDTPINVVWPIKPVENWSSV